MFATADADATGKIGQWQVVSGQKKFKAQSSKLKAKKKGAVVMATIERFKEVVESGVIIDADEMEAPLSPQMKYDYMAAINSMQQLEALRTEIENRKKSRAKLRAELLKSCGQSLKKIVEEEDGLTLKKIDTAIKMLSDCRYEITKIDSAERETDKLAKIVRQGVSA